MQIDIDNIDVDKIRQELINYYTSAIFTISPIAVTDLTLVENASDEEIIKIAIKNNFDLDRYRKSSRVR
jgi:hypothetical protein